MDQDAGKRLAQLFLTGGGVRQKLASEVEDKKHHETGRRASPEFLDHTVLHEISRRIQP